MVKKTVMVVDDDPAILDVCRIVLEDEGFKVKTYQSAKHLYKLNNDRPDLILLDILLAGEDGREICSLLKKNPKTKSIPVILFSAHIQEKIGERKGADQADYFIPKPFDVNELVSIVRRFTSSKPS